jgi:hypothetical protein
VLVTGQGSQAVHVFFGANDDAAAVAPVAAVRPPAGDLVLMPEAHAAVAAVSPLDEYRDAIEKHDRTATSPGRSKSENEPLLEG